VNELSRAAVVSSRISALDVLSLIVGTLSQRIEIEWGLLFVMASSGENELLPSSVAGESNPEEVLPSSDMGRS
jgi:hypothetical protein